MQEAHFTEDDRKILTTLSVQMSRALDDIKDLKDNYAGKINALETNKVDKIDSTKCHEDFETRIRSLEVWKWGLVAGFSLLGFLVSNNFIHFLN